MNNQTLNKILLTGVALGITALVITQDGCGKSTHTCAPEEKHKQEKHAVYKGKKNKSNAHKTDTVYVKVESKDMQYKDNQAEPPKQQVTERIIEREIIKEVYIPIPSSRGFPPVYMGGRPMLNGAALMIYDDNVQLQIAVGLGGHGCGGFGGPEYHGGRPRHIQQDPFPNNGYPQPNQRGQAIYQPRGNIGNRK